MQVGHRASPSRRRLPCKLGSVRDAACMRPFLACVSIVLLAACGSGDPGASGQSEASEPAPTEPAQSEATGDAPMEEPADVAGDSPVILQSDGIGVVIDSDSPAPLPFESDEQTVLTALETA